MLLSIPTWFIHISSMVEWGLAALMLYRYGRLIRRRDVEQFALLMLPHWIGGLSVIAFHLTGDSAMWLLDASKVINMFGSISLLLASVRIIRSPQSIGGIAFLGFLLFQFGLPNESLKDTIINAVFQLSSLIYIFFLISLLFLYRKDKAVFSKLTIVGFWFVIVFVSITVGCIYYATKVHGHQSLTYDDFLHGFAESFLTISNLMIVLGIRKKMREAQKNLFSEAT
jgi:hypothetical protein